MELGSLLRATIIAFGVILSVPPISAGFGEIQSTPEMRDSWYLEKPIDMRTLPKWKIAPKFVGFGTTYDAYRHSGAWYDSSDTWLSSDDNGNWLTNESCKQHPEWECYMKDFGSWSRLVRKWSSTLGDMYGALGPKLRKIIGEQMPSWHFRPIHTVLVTSLATGKSVEVWIADYCACGGSDKKQNTKDDPLIDLSPQVWAALGAYKDGHHPPNVKGWTNSIEVRFIP